MYIFKIGKSIKEEKKISKVGPVFSKRWLRHTTDTVITYHSIGGSGCFNIICFDYFPQLKNLGLKYKFPTNI